MISFAKPRLTQDLYIVQMDEFNNIIHTRYIYLTKAILFMRDKQILSSERILYKDYDSKGSTEKYSLEVVLKGPDSSEKLSCSYGSVARQLQSIMT
jgi:hypothetical protein